MQILLRVVPSLANYQVWWPYKTDISFCGKLYMNSSFVTIFFFSINNQISIQCFATCPSKFLFFVASELLSLKNEESKTN